MKFNANTIEVNGHNTTVQYSVTKTGDIYAFLTLSGTPVRLHIATDNAKYAEAKAAADLAKQEQLAAKVPAKQEAPKAKAAEVPAKQETPKAKAAKVPAKQEAPKAAEAPAKQEAPKSWIGTVITGEGWNIAFDAATQRTRVLFQAVPSAKQKAAIEAAGFYYSSQLNSWNKKLTVKAYKAAMELAKTLRAIA